MNACHDPYRELELYLEKAQEEIGKAFEELDCDNASFTEQCTSWNNVEPLLPPPPAFRSSPASEKHFENVERPILAAPLNRVCYDGDIIDFVHTLPSYTAKSTIDISKRTFPPPLRKTLSSPGTGSFFSRINATLFHQDVSQTKGKETKFDYSPETKRRLLQLRSSLSVENGMHSSYKPPAKKLLSKSCETAVLHTEYESDCFANSVHKLTGDLISPDATVQNMRPRSFSDTSAPKSWPCSLDDHSNTFPRPPSGDVNLLSIWADNLVLEVDRSFSGELTDSLGTCSPVSECSFCSAKQEGNGPEEIASLTGKRNDFHLKRAVAINERYSAPSPQYQFTAISDDTSPSPDSGIEQVRVEIFSASRIDSDDTSVDCIDSNVDSTTDCVDSVIADKKNNLLKFPIGNECDPSVLCDAVFDSITPPPPEFDDDPRRFMLLPAEQFSQTSENKDVSNAETQTESSSTVRKLLNKKNCLLAANSVIMTFNEELESSGENSKSIHRLARVVPVASTTELEDNLTVSTTCSVAEDSCWRSYHLCAKESVVNARDEACVSRGGLSTSPAERVICSSADVQEETSILGKQSQKDVFCNDGISKISSGNDACLRLSTLPKQAIRLVDADRLSSSLPRHRSQGPSSAADISIPPQRASSSPAVSSILKASVDEVAAFMCKVKNSTYYPPPHADVCVDVKNSDCDSPDLNKDAVTQTTPVFSRSSSFTWVAECDCSDFDSISFLSSSEDSLFLSCSNCTPGKQTPTSSSSASPLTSEEEVEEQRERSRRSSVSSSLSLSASSLNSGEKDSSIAKKNETASPEEVNVKHDEGIVLPKVVVGQDLSIDSDVPRFSGSSSGAAFCNAVQEKYIKEIVSIQSIESSPSSVSSDSASTDIVEQSSSFPSTLKSSKVGLDHVVQVPLNEFHAKSASAPVLRQKRNIAKRKNEDTATSSSSHSRKEHTSSLKDQESTRLTNSAVKELSELQAIEACTWLRAAGFPQYAQMYEDNLFPIEICTVQKDHAFLHPDSIQSLFRRLNTLNRCARMKFMDNIPRKSLHLDESDDEDQCALSENWQFQRTSRRWSRVPSPPEGLSEITTSVQEPPPSPKSYLYPPPSPVRKYLSPEETYCSSHDSVFIDEQNSSPDSVRRVSARSDDKYNVISSHRGGGCSPGSSSGSGGTLSLASEETLDTLQRNLRRTGSDKIKEGAKALFRRMESLKGKRKKKNHDTADNEHRCDVFTSMTVSSGTDGSSSSSMTPSPQLVHRERTRNDSLHDASDCSQGGTPQLKHRKKGWGTLFKGDSNNTAHSDSECPVLFVSERWKDANCNDTKVVEHYMTSQTSVTITTSTQNQELSSTSKNQKVSTQESTNCSLLRPSQVPQKNRWLSENFGQAEEGSGKEKRGSFYDNLPAPLAVFNNNCIQDLQTSDNQEIDTSKSPSRSHDQAPDDGEIILINTERRDSGVGSSLTRGSSNLQAPWHCFFNHSSPAPVKDYSKGVPITTLSAPQVLVLRKLSLLKLTTLMEKFSPSSRTGWSWGVPKFIRRIRSPDNKGKVVFGVPLLLILQRTGQPLPVSIQAAIHYLRKTALDSTGLFRKSGVRSRIQNLRNLNESCSDKISYDDQQAYDVADMLKQYFRELPEALLTNKLSETFISIHQYIPEELRLEAIQAAILLMPDENREVLQSLLSFLQEVCEHSSENQMTATNLAVCFAPSLFHLSTPRSASASPRRRKTVGVPDLRELNENRAAYECLSTMIAHYKELFSISEEMLLQCRLSYTEDCEPASLEALTSAANSGQPGWKVYIDSCILSLLKEVKDKSKGWINFSQNDGIELFYRKVGDGHPLRLWRVSTEIEAPPVELLNRILWERHLWDSSFLKWRVLQRLDKHTEIYQYVSSALPPHPPCDYCVLRSWKTDLPKGTCVLIETSIDYPESQPMIDGVRAIVLASRFFIEPCGSGKSRITHISRVDTRGRSPEWYNRAYGHICILQMTRLRDSFSHSTRAEGPETKV